MRMDEALTLSMFFESWELFRDSVFAGAIGGGVLGFLGVYVVLRRMVFLSAALSQVAGLGVALTFFASITFGLSGWVVSPSLGAMVLSMGAVALVLMDRSPTASRRDAMLGVLFLFGSASTLALGTRIVEEIQDIQTLLFGTAVAVVPEELHQLAIVAVLITLLHLWWWRGFVAVSVDPESAEVRGLKVRGVELVLLTSLALGISVVTRILGALPAFAFSVLPAIAALQISPNVPRAMWIAGVIGAFCGAVGYVVAFLASIPVGASQTLVAIVVVCFFYALGRVLKMVKSTDLPSAS